LKPREGDEASTAILGRRRSDCCTAQEPPGSSAELYWNHDHATYCAAAPKRGDL